VEAPAREPAQISAIDRDNVSSRSHELRCCRRGTPASRPDAGTSQGLRRFFCRTRGGVLRERRRRTILGALSRLDGHSQERLRQVADLLFIGTYACRTRQFFAESFECAVSLPATEVSIDCLPARQVVRQHPPGATGRPAVVDRVDDFARRQLQRSSGTSSALEQRSNPIPLRV
jgi:hypothetical protein